MTNDIQHNMISSSLRKNITFLSLYIAQSVPMSLFSTLLPVLMRQQEFSLTAIGMLQLIKLPWIVKFLWAPVVDRSAKGLRGYKSWIFASECVYAFFIFAIAYLRLEVHFPLVLALIVAAFVCSATQDIATDALTALSFNSHERSRGNGIQSMGSFAGTILGGGLLLVVYQWVGWRPMFTALACFVILMLIPLYFYRDDSFEAPQGKRPVSGADIYRFFTQKDAWRQVLFLFLYNAGIVGILAMMKPYIVDLGFSTAQIGVMFNLYGAAFGLVASFVCARLIKRIGRARAALGISLAMVCVCVFFAFAAWFDLTATVWVYLQLALIWAVYGLATVLVYTIAMDYVRQGREGTDFTLQIVVLHISSIIIAVASGRLSDILGYAGFFVIEAFIAIASLCYIKWSFARKLTEYESSDRQI